MDSFGVDVFQDLSVIGLFAQWSAARRVLSCAAPALVLDRLHLLERIRPRVFRQSSRRNGNRVAGSDRVFVTRRASSRPLVLHSPRRTPHLRSQVLDPTIGLVPISMLL